MSLQNELIKFVMMYRRKAIEKQRFDLYDTRKKMDKLFIQTFITPWTVHVNPIEIAGISAEIITPSQLKKDNAIILYVHGGGYFMGSIDTHRPLAGWLVHETGIPAIIFNYRLAPEHPFPAGRDDVIKVYTKILEEYAPSRVILVGDSAGGGLIMQALMAIKALQLSMPAACCLMSPFLDLSCSSASITNNASVDPFIIPKFIKAIIPYYIQSPYHPTHHEVNPLHADLSKMPPTLIQVGSIEVLLDDARKLAQRIEEHKGISILREYQNLPHVWQFNRQFFMPESQEALQEIALFIYRFI